ncbi:MAG: NUDIX domain-containing protein [Bacteroidales bacterium]|nr:NUDIX domain-containing protein [Bacteroidales bacterium]
MPSTYYSQYPKFHVAVDCIIFGFKKGQLKVLLQKRPFEPRQGEWSLMGGFVKRDEDIDSAAQRVLYQLTGLKTIYMKQVGAFGSVNRDSGDRVISIAFFALVDIDRVNEELNHENSAYWEDMEKLPPLLFDHKEMIEGALKKLRGMINRHPVGFELLPPLFTLTQLQLLYETILGEKIDKRNFRKRVGELSFIEKTDAIDKQSSKRGAALYRFNGTVYQKEPVFKL